MSLHCDHCGSEVDATVRFDEDDDRGIWLRCTNTECDKSGRFGGDDIRVVNRGRGVVTDGGVETTQQSDIHHYECLNCGEELDWVEIEECPSCGSSDLEEIHVITDGGAEVTDATSQNVAKSNGLDRDAADEAFSELKDARYYWGKPTGGQTVGHLHRARDLLNDALPDAYVPDDRHVDQDGDGDE